MKTNGVRIYEQKGGLFMHLPTIRVLKILDTIAEDSGGKRLSDFSRELGIPKSTLFPILQTLCERHYLSQNDAGRYTAGTALFSLGATFSGNFPVLDYVRSQLTEMVGLLGETCYCGALSDGHVLYLEKVDSNQPVRVLTNTGKRLPAYATSLGKALLMDKAEEELIRLYPDGFRPLTAKTIPNVDCLYAQIRQARLDGYTWEIEESTEHIRCFAVPIRKSGKIVAAISVAIPLYRYQEEKRQEIVSILRDYANRIGCMIEKTNANFGDSY